LRGADYVSFIHACSSTNRFKAWLDAAVVPLAGRSVCFVIGNPAAPAAKKVRQHSLSSLLFGPAFNGSAAGYNDTADHGFCNTSTETCAFNTAGDC
jgi:hypothetical protein